MRSGCFIDIDITNKSGCVLYFLWHVLNIFIRPCYCIGEQDRKSLFVFTYIYKLFKTDHLLQWMCFTTGDESYVATRSVFKKIIVEANRTLLSLNKDSRIVKGSKWLEDGTEMTWADMTMTQTWYRLSSNATEIWKYPNWVIRRHYISH